MDQTSLPSRADTTIPDPLPRGYSQLSRVNHIVDETDWNPSWGWTVGSVISTEHDLKIWAKRWPPGIYSARQCSTSARVLLRTATTCTGS
jgi:hypothetical protein